MLNTYYELPVSFFNTEVNSVKKENSPLDQRVTSVATEILEMAHGLKEYGQLYKDKPLMDRFKNGSNIDNLALAKIQRRFTTLKGRVQKLKDVDPRIEGIFKKMVKVGIDDRSERGGLASINKDIFSLIGKENIIDSGPFLKHGIICVKDSAMPDPRPVNLVSETELKEMIELRKMIFNPKAGVFHIKGWPPFVAKTKNNLEKLLTVEGGRQLLRGLCDYQRNLVICAGPKDEAAFSKNRVLLSNVDHTLIGHVNSLNVSSATPKWIVMGHELIHMLHHYAGTLIDNVRMVNIPNKDLWSNREEYETIGDPTKDINPISENGLRKNSLHPLRIYHQGGNISNDLEKRVTKCISANINGELIELLRGEDLTKEQIKEIMVRCSKTWSPELSKALLAHTVGKEIIKENFQLFFAGVKLNKDEKSLEIMQSEFPSEYSACQEYRGSELFSKMLNYHPELLMRWYNSSENKEVYDFKPAQISDIRMKLLFKWESDLAMELLNYEFPVGENFDRFQIIAKRNNDQVVVEKLASGRSSIT